MTSALLQRRRGGDHLADVEPGSKTSIERPVLAVRRPAPSPGSFASKVGTVASASTSPVARVEHDGVAGLRRRAAGTAALSVSCAFHCRSRSIVSWTFRPRPRLDLRAERRWGSPGRRRCARSAARRPCRRGCRSQVCSTPASGVAVPADEADQRGADRPGRVDAAAGLLPRRCPGIAEPRDLAPDVGRDVLGHVPRSAWCRSARSTRHARADRRAAAASARAAAWLPRPCRLAAGLRCGVLGDQRLVDDDRCAARPWWPAPRRCGRGCRRGGRAG